LEFATSAIVLSAWLIAAPAVAENPGSGSQRWAIHGQTTFLTQGVGAFHSPYSGSNSLTPHQVKETFDATLHAGFRPWAGAELWINPEIDQGFGLSNTLGAAGFPSGEAYKVGKSDPYAKLPRWSCARPSSLAATVRRSNPISISLREDKPPTAWC